MLLRAWVFCAALIGFVQFLMLGGMNASFQEWAMITAILSALLFAVGGGLVWVIRGSRAR